MPEEKKRGVIGTLVDRWKKFTSLGERGKKPERTVDTGRVKRGPVRPQPNPQQKRAIEAAKRKRRRETSGRKNAR